jgi:hypothetical protein
MAKPRIRIKKKNQGALHRSLGVKQGAKIPASKLAKAKRSSNPLTRRRATFAQNARKWRH